MKINHILKQILVIYFKLVKYYLRPIPELFIDYIYCLLDICYNTMRRKIAEQNECSMSLHSNTNLIQEYPNIDDSDEMDKQSSSKGQSLSKSREQYLDKMYKIKEKQKKQQQRSFDIHQKKSDNARNRPMDYIKNISHKYDLDCSPSTKEEYSLINPQTNKNRKSNPKHNYKHSNLPNIDSDDYEENEYLEEDINNEVEQSSQSAKSSGRVSKMQRRPNISKSFNIDNFLNAQPIQVKNKKGVKIFQELNLEKQRYILPQIKEANEKDSINLITFPQIDYHQNHIKITQIMRKNQQQISKVNDNYQRRFNEARLNFMDTFMPESLKIKKNPYALLKYITNKVYR